MPVAAMNHFTILTDNLEATIGFYGELLDLHPGARPPFAFPGVWLYPDGGGTAVLHVIAGRKREELRAGVIDHVAFSARDLRGILAKLKGRGIPYELRRLPAQGTWQLFFHDPNGAKVELDFDAGEAEA
jgi:catechol 2,3-dioxygenase-like lactoylglutathione lyase family enzyme